MRNDRRTVHRAELARGLWSLHEKRRQELIRMLEACGIDPRYVPRDTPLRRGADSVALEKYALSDDGHIVVGPDGAHPAVETIEVHPPAHLVPDWIPVD